MTDVSTKMPGPMDEFCSEQNCDCSGPDAPVACIQEDLSCDDTTCEQCYYLEGGSPAGGMTCWDWGQSLGNCILEPGAPGIPDEWPQGYCFCKVVFDQFACSQLGGSWGGYGSNCDSTCENPNGECNLYPPGDLGSCLTDCLGGVDAIVTDHMQSCRDVYNDDQKELDKLLKKIDPDDPLRCILICEIESMFCQCKELGEKKRCLLANVCWVAYDQRNGTNGAGAVLADCLSQLPSDTFCEGFGLNNNRYCDCNEILGHERSGGVFDLHSGGGKFIKKMYEDFYSVMDAFENSSTPESLPLGDDDCSTRCSEYFHIQLVIKNVTTFKKLNRLTGVLETFAVIDGATNTNCPACDGLPGHMACAHCCDGLCRCLDQHLCGNPTFGHIPIPLEIEGIYPQGINFEYFNAPIYATIHPVARNTYTRGFSTDPIRIPEDGGLIKISPSAGPYSCCITLDPSNTKLAPDWDFHCQPSCEGYNQEQKFPDDATCCKSNSIYPINKVYPEHLIPTSWGLRPDNDFTHPDNSSPGTTIRIATKSDTHHITLNPNARSGEPPVARSMGGDVFDLRPVPKDWPDDRWGDCRHQCDRVFDSPFHSGTFGYSCMGEVRDAYEQCKSDCPPGPCFDSFGQLMPCPCQMRCLDADITGRSLCRCEHCECNYACDNKYAHAQGIDSLCQCKAGDGRGHGGSCFNHTWDSPLGKNIPQNSDPRCDYKACCFKQPTKPPYYDSVCLENLNEESCDSFGGEWHYSCRQCQERVDIGYGTESGERASSGPEIDWDQHEDDWRCFNVANHVAVACMSDLCKTQYDRVMEIQKDHCKCVRQCVYPDLHLVECGEDFVPPEEGDPNLLYGQEKCINGCTLKRNDKYDKIDCDSCAIEEACDHQFRVSISQCPIDFGYTPLTSWEPYLCDCFYQRGCYEFDHVTVPSECNGDGACCVGDSSSVDAETGCVPSMSAEDCITFGGTFMGGDTTCESCPIYTDQPLPLTGGGASGKITYKNINGGHETRNSTSHFNWQKWGGAACQRIPCWRCYMGIQSSNPTGYGDISRSEGDCDDCWEPDEYCPRWIKELAGCFIPPDDSGFGTRQATQPRSNKERQMFWEKYNDKK